MELRELNSINLINILNLIISYSFFLLYTSISDYQDISRQIIRIPEYQILPDILIL